jgi:hypothetical protein
MSKLTENIKNFVNRKKIAEQKRLEEEQKMRLEKEAKRAALVTAIREKVYPTSNLVRVCVGKETVHYKGVTFTYNVYGYYFMDMSREELLKKYPEVVKKGFEVSATRGFRVTGEDNELGYKHDITLKENKEDKDREKGHYVVTLYSDSYTPRKTRYYVSDYPASEKDKQNAFLNHIDDDLGNRKTVKGSELQEMVNELNQKSFKEALKRARAERNQYKPRPDKYEREIEDALVR